MAENKKARFEYEILETCEAGLALTGDEVKSLRNGGMRLEGAFVRPLQDGLWLIGANIARYQKQGHPEPHDPIRSRKLLVRKKELGYFKGKLQEKGLTLVPLRVYPSGRRFKLLFGLGRGKRLHDKRAAIKERDLRRLTGRAIRGDKNLD